MTTKSGMYFETPAIKIGKYSIYEMLITTDEDGNETCDDRVWVQLDDAEGGEFPKALLEPFLEEFFNKHF